MEKAIAILFPESDGYSDSTDTLKFISQEGYVLETMDMPDAYSRRAFSMEKDVYPVGDEITGYTNFPVLDPDKPFRADLCPWIFRNPLDDLSESVEDSLIMLKDFDCSFFKIVSLVGERIVLQPYKSKWREVYDEKKDAFLDFLREIKLDHFEGLYDIKKRKNMSYKQIISIIAYYSGYEMLNLITP